MLKDYSQIVTAMKNTPWLILPESLQIIVDIVNMRLSGQAFTDEEIRIRLEEAEKDEKKNARVEIGGGVGIVPIYGPIFPKSNLMTALSGATSSELVRNDIQELLANDDVQNIVLDIDSPGGASDMISETGTAIREARDTKPIFAVANTTAASAAFWLASQATKFYSTPSGKVGSLGVYSIHEDLSRQDENEGRKVTIISAGRYKTAGNSHEPLSAEAKAYIQELVDESQERFIEAVAEGRGLTTETVRSDFGEGKMFAPKKAQEVGMIDGIQSLDEVVGSLLVKNETTPYIQSVLTNAMSRQHQASLKLGGGLRSEHAPEEHSDPGTGIPPPPKETPVEKDRKEGWRRDTPPIAKQEAQVADVLAELRSLLSLSEDSDVVAEVTKLYETNSELVTASEAVKERKAFAEMYPEQAQKLKELEEKDRKSEAKAFANSLTTLRFKSADDKDPKFGLSAKVIELLEDKHVVFAEGTATVSDFTEIFTEMFGEGGIVHYGEVGSSRELERKGEISGNPRKEFAQLVASIMEQDELEREAAITEAAKRDPELFEAYKR